MNRVEARANLRAHGPIFAHHNVTVNTHAQLERLRSFFGEIGVTNLVPGFYDDSAFVRAEHNDPTLLDRYAEYCVYSAADKTYRERAAERILQVTSFIAPLVASQARDGSCAPTTLLLQRFLDEHEVWNFPQKGSVEIGFPPESNLAPKLLEWDEIPGGTHGHIWNVAPPFTVIDLTIAQQFYKPAEEIHIAGYVIAEEVTPAITDPCRSYLRCNSNYRRLFPAIKTPLGRCTISYFPQGTGVPNETFAEMKFPVLDGVRPSQLYQRFLASKRNRDSL